MVVKVDFLSVGITALAAIVIVATPLLAKKSKTDENSETSAPTQVPSDVITTLNSNLYKLVLPINEEGQDNTEVANLAGRYTDPHSVVGIFLNDYAVKPYFWATNDEVVFRAHCAGVTTSGSTYPRCELRQRVGNGDNYFLLKDPQSLTATMRVTELPVHKQTIIMIQIHASSDEGGGQPFSLYCEGGVGIYFLYNEEYTTRDNPLAYQLGDTLQCEVNVDNSIIDATVTNTRTEESITINYTSGYESGNFQIGCYTLASIFQNEVNGGTDEPLDAAGEVRISALEITETYNREDADHDTLTEPPSGTVAPGLN